MMLDQLQRLYGVKLLHGMYDEVERTVWEGWYLPVTK
jgi:hypothetical protein